MTDTIASQLARVAERIDGSLDLAAVRLRVRRRRRRRTAQRGLAAVALAATASAAVVLLGTSLPSAGGVDRVAIGPVAPVSAPRPVMTPDVISLPDALPPRFVDRLPLPSCGTYELAARHTSAGLSLSQNLAAQADPTLPMEAARCLLGAVGSAAGAELGAQTRTVEVAPVVAWYRALPDSDRIEVYRDTTAGEWGPHQWTYELCGAGPSSRKPVRDCSTPLVLARLLPPCVPIKPMAIYDLLRVTGGAATPELAADAHARFGHLSTGGWLQTRRAGDTVQLRNADLRVSTWQGRDGTWFVVQSQRCATPR